MIGLITKNSHKGDAPITRSFALKEDVNGIVKFVNRLSDLSNGAVNKVDKKEIVEQISIAAIIVMDMNDDEIVGYMGSKIVGHTKYNLPIIELRSGAISKEYGGNGINGENRAILLDAIRERYPDSIIVSIKNSANGEWSAKSLQSMGFLYPKSPNTLETYKKDPYMAGIGIPEEFFEQKKNGTPDRTVWIGIQTRESYDKFYNPGIMDMSDPKLLTLAQEMLRKKFKVVSKIVETVKSTNDIKNPTTEMLRTGVRI